jgi:hypothetical protein
MYVYPNTHACVYASICVQRPLYTGIDTLSFLFFFLLFPPFLFFCTVSHVCIDPFCRVRVGGRRRSGRLRRCVTFFFCKKNYRAVVVEDSGGALQNKKERDKRVRGAGRRRSRGLRRCVWDLGLLLVEGG